MRRGGRRGYTKRTSLCAIREYISNVERVTIVRCSLVTSDADMRFGLSGGEVSTSAADSRTVEISCTARGVYTVSSSGRPWER